MSDDGLYRFFFSFSFSFLFFLFLFFSLSFSSLSQPPLPLFPHFHYIFSHTFLPHSSFFPFFPSPPAGMFFFTFDFDLSDTTDSLLSLFLLSEWCLTSYFFSSWHLYSCGSLLFIGAFPICLVFFDRNYVIQPLVCDVICLFGCSIVISFSFFGLEGVIEGPNVTFCLLFCFVLFPSLVVANEGFGRVERRYRVGGSGFFYLFHLTPTPLWASLIFVFTTKKVVVGEGGGGILGVFSQYGVVLCFFMLVVLFHLAIFCCFNPLKIPLGGGIFVGLVLSLVGVCGGFDGFFGLYVVWLVWSLLLCACFGVYYYDEVLVPARVQRERDEFDEKKMLWKASFSTKGSRRGRR